MENKIEKSKLFSKEGAGQKKSASFEKFVIEDCQNQDQGESASNNLVVRMDKSRRNNIFLNFEHYHSII